MVDCPGDTRPGFAPLPLVDIGLEEKVSLREIIGPSGQCSGMSRMQD
jgi:hypothetical protein